MNRLSILLAVFLLGAFSLGAQQQSQQNTSNQAAPPTVRATTSEVVLDSVLPDKKGRTFHDRRPEEMHVIEDSVEQKIASFRLVAGEAADLSSAPKPAAEAGAPAFDPMREVRLVTLVFEALGQQG